MADIADQLHGLATLAFEQGRRLHNLTAELATRADPNFDPMFPREVGRGWQSASKLGQHLTHVAINLDMHDGEAELAAGTAALRKLADLEARAVEKLGS